MCDVVEHATALQASITEMRWRMLRGEFNPMQAALWRTKTNLKELTRSLGLLEHYIKDDFDKGETQ
jgi:hypothetical protein